MKLYIKADAYNELIEKGYGKRDLSKLTRKVITDKNGHRRTVFVKNEVQTTNKNSSKAYWIQDFRGNRLTNEDAKKNIKEVNENIKRFESKIENGDKATKVAAEAAIKRMQNYKEDLISKLKPEDRKEVEIPVKETKNKNESILEKKNAAENLVNTLKEIFPDGDFYIHSSSNNELGLIGKIRASAKDIKGNEKDIKFEYIKDDTRNLSNGKSEKGVSVRIMGADYFIPETADAKRYVNNVITWNLNKELYGDSYKKHAVDYVENMAKDDTKFQDGVNYAAQWYKDNKLSGKNNENAKKDIDYQIDLLEYKLNPDNKKDSHVTDVESNYRSLLAWKKLKKEYN